MMKKYESLCARILQMESHLEPKLDLSIMSMFSGMKSKEADEIFFQELGMSGAEVIRSLCSAHQKDLS